MIYRILNSFDSPTARRLMAVLFLLLFIPTAILSISLGIVFSFGEFLWNLSLDLLNTIKRDVPTVVRDFIRVIKTGKEI